MIPWITYGNFLKGLIQYNEDKIESGEASLIYSNSFDNTVDGFKMNYFDLKEKGRANLKNSLMHISLNFSPKDQDKISTNFYTSIVHEFLRDYGIPNDHPYLVYQHKDKSHPHVHIIIPTIKSDGTLIGNKNRPAIQMQKICRKLEEKHNLTKALDEKKEKYALHKKEENYTQVKEAIYDSVHIAMSNKPTSLAEFKKYLNNQTLTYNGTTCKVLLHERIKYPSKTAASAIQGKQIHELSGEEASSEVIGYSYTLVNESGKEQGKTIKSSTLSYPFKKVLAECQRNAAVKARLAAGFHKNIILSFSNAREKGMENLLYELTMRQIGVEPFYTATGDIFGWNFIDKKTGIRFKGSEINGKLLGLKSLSYQQVKNYISTPPIVPKTTVTEVNKNEKPTPQKPNHMLPKLDFTEIKRRYSIMDIAQMKGYAIDKSKSTKTAHVLSNKDTGDKIIVYKNLDGSERYHSPDVTDHKGSVLDFLVHKKFENDIVSAAKFLLATDGFVGAIGGGMAGPPERAVASTLEKPKYKIMQTNSVNEENNYGVSDQGIPLDIMTKYFDAYVRSVSAMELRLEMNRRYGKEGADNFLRDIDENSSFNVFPYYDLNDGTKTIVGQEVRGKNFKHILSGSNKTSAAWHKFDTMAKNVVVTESPYKCMAYHTLYGGDNNYIASSGTPSGSLIDYLCTLEGAGKNLILGGDNDASGIIFNFRIISKILNRTTGCQFVVGQEKVDNKMQFRLSMTHSDNAIFSMNAERIKRLAERVGGGAEIDNGTIHLHMEENAKMQSLLNHLIKDFHVKAKQIIPFRKDFNDDLLFKREQLMKKSKRIKIN